MLSILLRRLPIPDRLTRVHVDFMRTAVARKCYLDALPIAELPMMHMSAVGSVDPDLGPVTATDVLMYYYSAGMLHIAREAWAHAESAFLTVSGVRMRLMCTKFAMSDADSRIVLLD